MNSLLSFLLLCASGHLVAATWTQSHRDQITKIHNDYRHGTKDACDLTNLVYDANIEKAAEAWAKKCVFKHEMGKFGENIAWVTKYGKESDRIKEMAKMWYDEIKDFNYNAQGCGAACHYTQMVWANTKKLGCYAHHCPTLRQGGNNAYFLVCFYTPGGNYQGEKPYKKICKPGDKKKESNKGPSATNNNNNNNQGGNSKTNNNNAENWLPSEFPDMNSWQNGDGDDWAWPAGGNDSMNEFHY